MEKLTFKQSILASLLAGITTAVINGVLFLALHSAGIFTDDVMVQPETPLTLLPVVISSIIPLLIAGTIFFLIEKYTNNGIRIFSIAAIILTALSFISPFTIAGVTTSFAVGLCIMHVVAVASLLYFLNRSKKTNA